MTDDFSRKVLTTQDSADRLLRSMEPFRSHAATFSRLTEGLGIGLVAHELNRQLEVKRALLGPLSDLRASGMLNALGQSGGAFESLMRAVASYEIRFRRPDFTEASEILSQIKASGAITELQRHIERTSQLQRAVESMRSPWLDPENTLRSIGAFAELQGIGQAVNSMPPFGNRLAECLRPDLGDWRDKITWPAPVFTDLQARTEFYIARGFNEALTDFPASAFEETLEVAGLRTEPPALLARYNPPVPPSEDGQQEEAFERTNVVHDWLQRFETQIRGFIDREMTKAFGADWPKQRLPNGLLDTWQEKKMQAEQNGEPTWPLISYADFTDYERIICKRDNWREVFASCFGRPESIRESFQRLYLPRISAMHARPVTQDDELFVYVEVKRLMRLIIR